MSDKLTWIEFRRAHPGLDKKQKSALYQAYKADDKDTYLELLDGTGIDSVYDTEKVTEEVTEEVVEEAVEEPVKETKEEPKKKSVMSSDGKMSLLDMLKLYNRASKRLITWGPSMAQEEKDKAYAILKRYAKETMDHLNPKYTCTDTDAWERWEGQEGYCILLNATNGFAFECTRAWWNYHYQGARYVQAHTFRELGRMDEIKQKYIRQKRYMGRPPLPDVEIMLPRTARDFHKPE